MQQVKWFFFKYKNDNKKDTKDLLNVIEKTQLNFK